MKYRPRQPENGPSTKRPPNPNQNTHVNANPNANLNRGVPLHPGHPHNPGPSQRVGPSQYPPQQMQNNQGNQAARYPYGTAKFAHEEYAAPQRKQKPIPASVPSVDVDDIASALSQLSQELDHMEQSGQVRVPSPEAIDDLVVVDMYTPKEQIPASKRTQAAQRIAMQGPAEEGAYIRQNQLIQALRAAPAGPQKETADQKRPAPSKLQQSAQSQPKQEKAVSPPVQQKNISIQQVPEPELIQPEMQPVVFNREPDKPQSLKNELESLNPMLEAFEAAVYSKGPGEVTKTDIQEQVPEQPDDRDLSQDKFSERLQLKSDAYKVEREYSLKDNNDLGMSLDDLHTYYASQKDERAPQELAEQEQFLTNNPMPPQQSGGFLSGLGSSDQPESPISQSSETPFNGQFNDDAIQQAILEGSLSLDLPPSSQAEPTISTSGGFLAGVEKGVDQDGAIASRDIGGINSFADPLQGTAPEFNNVTPDLGPILGPTLAPAPPAAQAEMPADFLESLNAFQSTQTKPPLVQQQPVPPQQHHAPIPNLESSFSDLWQTSENISPAAKAYKDALLFGDNPPQQQAQPRPVPNLQEALAPQVPQGAGEVHHPLFQNNPVIQQKQQEPQHFQAQIQPDMQAPFLRQQQQGFQPSQQSEPQKQSFLQEDSPSFLNKPSPALQTSPVPDIKPVQPAQTKPLPNIDEKASAVDKKRRRAVKIYFGKRPLWTAFTAMIGIGLISSQGTYDPIREWVVMTPSWILLAGMIIFAASVAWRYLSIRKPKEETLDDWAAEDLMNLEKRAFETMQLQNRYLLLDPIVMSGFPDIESIDNEFVNGLYGADSILRYTPRALTVMCFTRGEILTYEGAVDLTTGQIVYETAREFFYSDIATVGMVKAKVKRRVRLANILVPWRWFFVETLIRLLSGRPFDRSAVNKKDAFQISLKDGTKVQLILRDARVLRENTFEELPLSTDEKVLQAITDFVVVQKTDQLAGYR